MNGHTFYWHTSYHPFRILPLLLLCAAWLLPSMAQAAPQIDVLTVQGRALGDGKALLGAEVLLFAGDGPVLPSHSGLWADPPAPVVRIVTDRRGRFTIELPRPGLWRVWINAKGRATVRSRVLPILESLKLPPAELPGIDRIPMQVSVSEQSAADAWISWHAQPDTHAQSKTEVPWGLAPILARTDGQGLGEIALPRGAHRRVEITGGGVQTQSMDLSSSVADVQQVHMEPQVVSTPVRFVDFLGRISEEAWVLTSMGTPIGRTGADGSVEVPASGSELAGWQVLTRDGLLQPLLGTGEPQASDGIQTAHLISRRVSGRVLDDATGQPVAGALVWSGTEFRSLSGLTLSDGSYDCRVAGELPVELTIAAPDYVASQIVAESMAAGLARIEPDRVGVGYIESTGGQPISDAQVVLSRGGQSLSVSTDADGVFVVSNPRQGAHDLEVTAEGYQPVTITGGVHVSARNREVDLGVVSMAPGVRLEGWVLDPWGTPVAEAEVVLVPDQGPNEETAETANPIRFSSGKLRVMSTDEEGRFIADGLEPGVFDLRVRKHGFRATRLDGVDPRDTPSIELSLQQAPTLGGWVVTENGAAVADALITVRPASTEGDPNPLEADPDSIRSAQTDEEGRFDLVGLPTGAFDLMVGAAGFRPAEWLDIEVDAEADSKDLELVLEKGSRLFGRVFDSDGSPVVRATVQARRIGAGAEAAVAQAAEAGEAAASESFAQADEQGRFELVGLELGTYEVVAQDLSGRSADRQISLAADEAELEIWLEGGVDVSGRVVDTSGAPIVGAQVDLSPLSPSSPTPSTVSDSQGSFVFSRIAAGGYRLIASSRQHATHFSAAEIQVDQSPVTGLEAVLSKGVTLIGRVVGASFEELPHVVVRSVGPGGGGGASVDHQGHFELTNLRPGELVIEALVVGESRVARQNLTVPASSSTVEIELVLPARDAR